MVSGSSNKSKMVKLEVELCKSVIHFGGAEGRLGTGLGIMTFSKSGSLFI